MYYLPIIIVVVCTAIYHLCSKSMPKHVNPFFNILIVYIIALLASLAFFIISFDNMNLIEILHSINYAVPILALSLLGLELGFIMLYRVGWNISLGALVNGILASTILAVLGVILFSEEFGINRIIGLSLCFIGLFLLSKPIKRKSK